MSIEDDLNERYGPPPPGMKRPDHADFVRLVTIITEGIDKRAEAEDFDLNEFIAGYIDAESLSHMAIQRAIRVSGVRTPVDLQASMDTIMLMAALYTEAFVVGYEFKEGEQG